MRLSLSHKQTPGHAPASAWIAHGHDLIERMALERSRSNIEHMQREMIATVIAIVDSNRDLCSVAHSIASILPENHAFHVAKTCIGRQELLRQATPQVEAILNYRHMVGVMHWLETGYRIAERQPYAGEKSFTETGRENLRSEIEIQVAHLFPKRLERIDTPADVHEEVLHNLMVMGFEKIASNLKELTLYASMSIEQLTLISAHNGCKELFADEPSAMARAVNSRFLEEILTGDLR